MFTRSQLVSLAAGAALAASFVSVTPIAQAASLTNDQVGAVINLLQTFGADQTTITNVKSVLSSANTGSTTLPIQSWGGGGPRTSPPSLPPQANTCAQIATSLKFGSSGDDVMRLQSFLGMATTTGFFGRLTEEAVQHWQSEHGIVSTGTAATNGFGAVGPRTRAILNGEIIGKCGRGDDNSATSTAMKPLNARGPGEGMMGSSTAKGDN